VVDFIEADFGKSEFSVSLFYFDKSGISSIIPPAPSFEYRTLLALTLPSPNGRGDKKGEKLWS